MANYRITFARSARKELEQLDNSVVNRVFPRIGSLALEPRPRGCRKLSGEQSLWRIRVSDYRVVYAIDDEEMVVDIVTVRHRSRAYNN